MSPSADVRSIDAIRDYRADWLAVADEANKALLSAALEIRDALEWIEDDMPRFWRAQVRKAEDRVVEARLDLERCMITATSPVSCSDQRVQLERAKRRVVKAHEMVERVRKWGLIVKQEIGEYEAPSRQLTAALDTIVPAGAAMLDRMLSGLEAYAGVPTPTESSSPATSAARPTDEVEDPRPNPSEEATPRDQARLCGIDRSGNQDMGHSG